MIDLEAASARLHMLLVSQGLPEGEWAQKVQVEAWIYGPGAAPSAVWTVVLVNTRRTPPECLIGLGGTLDAALIELDRECREFHGRALGAAT